MTIPLTVIVLTKNEATGIGRTLDHLVAFDDVIVVDSHSTDDTVAISRAAGATVVTFTWDERYPKKKQWSLEHAGAKHPWVLLLDADEYPTAELVAELERMAPTLGDAGPGAYDITLSYRFAGRILRHGHTVTKRSLLDTRRTAFPVVDDLGAPGIREVEGHYQPVSSAPVSRVRGRLIHDDRDPVSSWFDRHNRYSDWEAHLRMNADARRDIASKRSTKGRIFDRVPFKPFLFFCYSYIARAGFLDGRAGFDYAVALSGYYWQIGVKYRELRAGE